MSRKSWFAEAASSVYPTAFTPPHTLPRWQTASSMTASIIPPPIISTNSQLPDRGLHETLYPETQPRIDSRQYEVEIELQALLDAQAEGLIHGLKGGSIDDHSSTGSTTPTLQSIRAENARRGLQVTKKKPGLRSARRGIYNRIITLAALKKEEIDQIDANVGEDDGNLARIDAWESKHARLREASREVDTSDENSLVKSLHTDANELQIEINRVEVQLLEMKAKHRTLLRQASEIENSVQARLASYTSSLRSLEQDVQRFLSLKPENISDGKTINGEESVWQLPPQKRNLAMARHFWQQQREVKLQQRQMVDEEKSALDEGASTWKAVVVAVQDFESQLRAETTLSVSFPGWEDPPISDPTTRLQSILKKMDALVVLLSERLNTAEDRRWNLLIAAIGAELDALKQGRKILVGVLGVEKDERQLSKGSSAPSVGSSEGAEIHPLDRNFEDGRNGGGSLLAQVEDDDEPDPELLFSVQHNDDPE